MLFIFVLPSFIWMTRNYLNVDEFSITGRGAEVLAVRAEYSTLTYEQIGHGFIYYTLKTIYIRCVQGRLWPKVTSVGSDVVYNRMTQILPTKKEKSQAMLGKDLIIFLMPKTLTQKNKRNSSLFQSI